MRKKIFIAAVIVTALIISCTENDKKRELVKDNKISLRSDTINVVKLLDTLVIYEGTCRGCAYENSTSFAISDNAGIIKMQAIVTTDNSAPDMAGGSVSKDIILVPQKTGSTIVKLYKFLRPDDKDSANCKLYSIEVKN